MSRTPKRELTGALARSSVKKNVGAVHVSGKLTLLQRKLVNALLLNAYDTLTSQQTHRIDARVLCELVGFNSNDMETLKASLRGLAETVAEWNLLDDKGEEEEWAVSSLLAYARLRGGVCDYSYSHALAEKLHDPKVFALINVRIMRNFTSGHGLALYENCVRFRRTRSTGWWPIDVFRSLMGVADSAYYQSFKNLNAKIIKPAVAEVNKVSDIVLTPEVRKEGRAVSHIRFLMEENPQGTMLDMDDGDGLRHGPVYARLRALGVSDRLARQWLNEHGDVTVSAKLDYIEGQTGVRHPAGYLRAVLEGSPASASEPLPVTPRSERLRRVSEAIAARTPTQRDADRRRFAATLTDPVRAADFERHGWMSPLNAEAIVAFWEEIAPGTFEDA